LPIVEAGDVGLVGQIAYGDQSDARVPAMRKGLRFVFMHVWHDAVRAVLDKRADDGRPKRAGAAGDHDMFVRKGHARPLSASS
jgi:hypothetical protein